MITAEYDAIATEYKESKELPFRKYIETFTLFELTGDIRGKFILDLACGEGFYTRKLKDKGAGYTLGIDISHEMIALAEKNERHKPRGCRYLQFDVATMPVLGRFDMVTAMYLLNYAKTREELKAFCEAAFRQLNRGGRFLGFNDNPANDPENYGNYRKYGFIKYSRPGRVEGDPIRYTFFNQDGTEFRFNNYYLSPETYREVFAEVGFVDFEWVAPSIHPGQQYDPFWLEFMVDPPVIGFSAVKP